MISPARGRQSGAGAHSRDPGHYARTFPRRVVRAVPFGRWRAEERGKGKKKIPSVREGWRGERGPCQVQAGRPDQGDASQSSLRRPARRGRRAQGGGERNPCSCRDPGRALCCIAAAHKGGRGGGPGLGASKRAEGLRHARGAALSQLGRPPPPRAHKEARERRTWPRRLQRRRLPARAAGSSLARRPRQHNRRAGAIQGSCAAPRRLAGVVVRARARTRAAQGRPRLTDYMSRPRRRSAPPRAPPAARPADRVASGPGLGGTWGRGWKTGGQDPGLAVTRARPHALTPPFSATRWD